MINNPTLPSKLTKHMECMCTDVLQTATHWSRPKAASFKHAIMLYSYSYISKHCLNS